MSLDNRRKIALLVGLLVVASAVAFAWLPRPSEPPASDIVVDRDSVPMTADRVAATAPARTAVEQPGIHDVVVDEPSPGAPLPHGSRFPPGTKRDQLSGWGKRMFDNPGADLGLLYCDYQIDVLTGRCEPESGMTRSSAADRYLTSEGFAALCADKSLNPSGVTPSAAAAGDIRGIIQSFQQPLQEASRQRELSTIMAAKEAVITGQSFVPPVMSDNPTDAERAAMEKFNESVRPLPDTIITGVPGRDYGSPGHIVRLTRTTHHDVFRYLDEENRLLAAMRDSIRQYFGQIR